MIDENPYYLELLSKVYTLANESKWDEAEEVAKSIRDNEDEQGQALAGIAQKLCSSNLLDRAERIAYSIPNNPNNIGSLIEKAIALFCIAQSYITSNKQKSIKIIGDIESILLSIEFPHLTAAVYLNEIAKILHSIERERAIKIWIRSFEIAKTQYEQSILVNINDAEALKSLWAIASTLIKFDEPDLAKTLIKNVKNEWLHKAIFEEISKKSS
jgi:hypothetical protein